MKNLLYIGSLFFISVSCIDMERELTTEFTESQAKTTYDNSLARVNSIYTDIPAGYLQIDGAMAAANSDEATHTLETSAVHRLNNGSWNSVDNPDNLWGGLYRGIRKATQFLESSDSINLDEYRLNPAPSAQSVYETRLAEITRWKNEARFLRAYFYFELIKRYGGVPIISESLDLDHDFGSIERNTLLECINYIISECDLAAASLPVTYPNLEMGRATKGAVLSLKAKTLLLAASELFNNPAWAGGYDRSELIALNGDRQARWKEAADAAKEVIDLSVYALHNNYRNLFINNSFTFSEIIFTRRNSSSSEFEVANYPIGYDLGNSGTTPSQDLVDAYEVVVSSTQTEPFDWNNPSHANNPYSNRDPRLGLSVILNNSWYKGRNVEIWSGGRDGPGVVNATRTGYYLKKYVNENLNLLQGGTSVKSWHIFRLADTYLSYAEALNEYNPGNPEILAYINMVRRRPGINMPRIPQGLDQDEMRNRIRHERRVELAFEDHRRWDLRRWMVAEEILDSPLQGVEVTRLEAGGFSYTPFISENRVFDANMYLYPIPLEEILISPNIRQNPGW